MNRSSRETIKEIQATLYYPHTTIKFNKFLTKFTFNRILFHCFILIQHGSQAPFIAAVTICSAIPQLHSGVIQSRDQTV